MPRFREEGLVIEEVIAEGGIPSKNPFVMQVTADVFNMPIKVVKSDQAVALGAAMFAAVASGIYSILKRPNSYGLWFSRIFKPDPEKAKIYESMYEQYLRVGGSLEEELRTL